MVLSGLSQEDLERIACDGDADVRDRIEAIGRLENQELIALLMTDDSEPAVAAAAARVLRDEQALFALAVSPIDGRYGIIGGVDEDPWLAALSSIKDQALIERVFLEAADYEIALAALERIDTDAGRLRVAHAMTDYTPYRHTPPWMVERVEMAEHVRLWKQRFSPDGVFDTPGNPYVKEYFDIYRIIAEKMEDPRALVELAKWVEPLLGLEWGESIERYYAEELAASLKPLDAHPDVLAEYVYGAKHADVLKTALSGM